MFKYYRVKQLKPHPNSVKARLPEAYKKFVNDLKRPPAPVNYIPEPGRYKLDPETKQKVRVNNRDIPLKFPTEADTGIWGGEGVIQGFIKEKKKRRRFPNYWVPKLKYSILYSEILNQYMKVTVTERTLKLIDENCGFDHYILGTPVQDIKSQLALKIRRKMLLALLNKEKYHEDEEKNEEVFLKYEKYMIPKEEAEWFGLTEREAVQKQRLLEAETIKPIPLKHQLRLQLIEELRGKTDKEKEEEEEAEREVERESRSYTSWLKRLNPFSS